MEIQYNPTTIRRENLILEILGDGDGKDTSGGGNNGTATNVTWVPSERGYKKEEGSYNGTSSFISIPDNNIFSFPSKIVSFEGTFKLNVNNVRQFIISKAGASKYEWGIEVGADGAFGASIWENNGNTIFSSNSIDVMPINETIHYVAIFNNGFPQLYINNTLLSATNFSSGTSYGNNTAPVKIGSRDDGVGDFNGQIGSCRIWNTNISREDVTALYLESIRELGPRNEEKAVSGFKKYSTADLEKGKILQFSRSASGGTYYDQTGNGNNGTPTNITDSTIGLNNRMEFNGSTSYIDISSVSTIFSDRKEYSILCTYDTDTISGVKVILNSIDSAASEYTQRNVILFQDGEKIRCLRYDGSATETPIDTANFLEVGKKYRIGFIYDGTNASIYVDGVQLVSVVDTKSATSGGLAELGRLVQNAFNGFYADGGFSGKTIIYDRALSAEEVQEDFYSNYIS